MKNSVNIVLNGETLVFLPKTRKKTNSEMSTLTVPTQHCTRGSSQSIKRKEIKGI